MADSSPMEVYARRVQKDAAIGRTRSMTRRLAGPLFKKYLDVVPSVFTARGELRAFRLLVPRVEALSRLRDRAVLTLDSATEALEGYRFGKARNDYAYFSSVADLEAIVDAGIGERRPGTHFPLAWTPPGWEMLFAVVPNSLPPNVQHAGIRVVTTEHLIRDLIGLYGLRTELLSAIETKLEAKT